MTKTPSAHDIARELLAREVVGVTENSAAQSAIRNLYGRVSANLRSSVGDDGYKALMSRALNRAGSNHPVLANLVAPGDSDVNLDALASTVDAHGLPVVIAAIEALLASLADLLSSLIGADMVLNLLDRDGTSPNDKPARPTT